ncbi:MAG: ribokinase [Actinomycetia bacterium]|nr:ribokinase [Actinomycetes bacterium]
MSDTKSVSGARHPDVVTVGAVNVDFVVTADHLPTAGETVTGTGFAVHGGGKGANQAVAAARAGAHTAFVGAVGDDELGAGATQLLVAEGIDIDAIAVVAGETTGVALITVDGDGENQISVGPGANGPIGDPIVAEALAGLEVRTGGVVLCTLEFGDLVAGAAADLAHRCRAQLIVNPAPARPVSEGLLDGGPILTPNEIEVEQLTGVSGVGAAARALGARTGRPVVVTLGAEGAIVVAGPPDSPTETRAPVPGLIGAPEQVVDTTGAGDTFTGALAAERARGTDLAGAVQWAVVAAALSVRTEGARGGMPSRNAVDAAIHEASNRP